MLAATAAVAADLPITSVTVLPGGLIIERAGAMPPGDESVSGLPATLDEGSLTVEVAGREVDGWRLVRPEPPPLPAMDPAAQQRLMAAERVAATAQLRARLAAGAREAATLKAGESPPLPGPEAIRAQVAFAASNAERGATEAQAAAEAADAARSALAGAPGAAPAPPVLRVPGIGGTAVRVRYLLPGASWAPAWRLEVDGGDATLVQLAVIEVSSSGALPLVPLTVATRGRADEALLADPSVPILGLAESVELERKQAVGGVSESMGSESSVDYGLRAFKRSLSEGGLPMATEANLVLVMLGAGYDHKTPNKYKIAVAKGIQRIAALDPARLDLPDLALATCALAEAYGMTSDPTLRPRAEAFVSSLRARWPRELPNWLARPGPLAGPETAMLVVQALKSSYSGGLQVGNDLHDLRRVDLGRGEEAELARLFIEVFTGGKAPFIDADTARRWIASFDRWWNAGQVELIEMALIVAFQNGGEEWRQINNAWRPRLTGLQIGSPGPDLGLWPLGHHPLGKLYGSALAARCLEIYYRYAQVSTKASQDISGRVEIEALADLAPEPVVQPSWPMRLTAAQPVALVPGRQVVELRRTRLAGAITWLAVPVQSPGVWRHLAAPNPWAAPLPGGPVTVVADGRQLGRTMLPAVAPGAVIGLDLGPDDRLRVRRTVRSATDDGVFKRTLTMTVSCRLEAPPGFTDQVQVREALPRPGGELIAVELVKPEELEGEAYAKRVAKDPLTLTTLSAAAPEAVLAELRLVYARSVRPRLEAR